MLRLSPEGYDRLFQNDRMKASFGGAEANVAVSLARFGEPVSFVSKVPEGQIGDGVVEAIRSAGVDASFVLRGGDRLGIYYLEKGVAKRSSICIYDRSGSSISKAQVPDFDWYEIFDGADWFHFTGITPALGGELPLICREACGAAKNLGLTVSCDLNYRSKLWSKEDARKTMSELCRYVDVCIGNEEDARNVFGIETENTSVQDGVIDKGGYESVAKKLQEIFGFDAVAFSLRTSHSATCNDWAGMLYDGKKYYHSREYHIDHIVDRVGSGDSFAGGLIYGMRKKWDGQRTLEFGVAASAIKHSIEGDFNRISVDEVLKLAEGPGTGRIER